MTIAEGFFAGITIILAVLLWLAANEYRKGCEAHIKSLKLSNENIGLLLELLRALPEPTPTPQLPTGNGQA